MLNKYKLTLPIKICNKKNKKNSVWENYLREGVTWIIA